MYCLLPLRKNGKEIDTMYIPKLNCRRLVDTSKLNVGVYKNFGELCETLGWDKPINSEQRKQDWKRLEHYCNIKRLPHSQRIEITEIYEEVK